jgi:AraC-like DNA-binding protein
MESRNFILQGSATQYYWKGTGLCSVKTFCNGPAHYNTGKGNFRVGEDSFLLLNDGTEYAIEIDHTKNVDSYCLFFDNNLLRSAFFSIGKNLDYQLTNFGNFDSCPTFFERTYPLKSIGNQLIALKQNQTAYCKDDFWLEQMFAEILDRLTALLIDDLHARAGLNAIRTATKQELFRRLLLAREFIQANADKKLSLQEIAHESCLSINHLLRSFKYVFGMSPHTYHTHLKMDHAERLLTKTDMSISEITESIGFVSLGSFSLLFKRYKGHSPEAFRKKTNR